MSHTMTSTPTLRTRMQTRLSSSGGSKQAEKPSPEAKPAWTPSQTSSIVHPVAPLTPAYASSTPVRKKTPLTPLHRSVVMNMRQRLEQQLSNCSVKPDDEVKEAEIVNGDDKVSPGLACLRNTPGTLKEKQDILIKKHKVSRSKSDQLGGAGGGYSIWPGMDSMRLSREESVHLLVVCICLIAGVLVLFNKLHGSTMSDLSHYYFVLLEFPVHHSVTETDNQAVFTARILSWHVDFKQIMKEIHEKFDVSLWETPVTYQLCVLTYTLGVAVLLYYLADNICSENKLSPRRIKIWMSLLVVIGTWTLLALKLLWLAQRLEYCVDTAIHKYISQMGDLVTTDLDLGVYNNVLQYWKTEYLPPTGRGTLNVFGVLPVRDIAYYLQYYSLPVITAIISPVIQLMIALKNIYTTKPPE